MRIVLLVLVLVLPLLATPATAQPRPVPVIYDSDLDVDDASTLAYLCVQHQRHRIDLRAVTVADNGFGVPGRTRQHALSVLAECGLPDVPVAEGAEPGVHPAPASAVRDMETVLTAALGDAGRTPPPATLTAAQLIRRTLAEAPGEVTVLATGPLSNLARAVPPGSPAARKIGEVHVMGGAISVPGNLFGEALPGFDNSQELNVWLDPVSARQVFCSLPVVLTPLDATDQVPIRQAYVDRIGAEGTTASAGTVHRIMTHPVLRDGIALGIFYWWDALAAVAAFGDPRVVTGVRPVRLDVVQDGPQSGRTRPDARGAKVIAASGADPGRFEEVFLAGLNGSQ
ncbi:pyrimidine-specific ribonucleoside hydrolase [Amycolatopsis sacchari]|uniref:Pyrimidine-specific ribonucleoside hydrolase n=1 Tax=Amycolatopsis sacchari TaxID=115433 RepID=A0A1I3Q7Q9_9PSEU|nr:nucleoside hydrolase [Amycolatopsis sacchari]SFJ30264.1 pyrimidine-specific ribonucleoside hydrolase [Amycolatopsis sacchari]